MSRWVLRYDVRPWTTNSERTWHHMKTARYVKEWREAFFWLAKEQKIPPCKAIVVVATPYLTGRGRVQDVGGCFPAAKASLDGIVDAKVIPDDSPTYVKLLGFRAPVIGQGNALELVISEIDP